VSLTFTPKRHLYTLDGERVPSVTSIVGVLPKGGLVYWAAKLVAEAVADQASTVDAVRALGRDVMVAALRAVPDQAKRKAGDRGSLLHELATGVVKGEPSELIADPDIAGCLAGLARWFDDVGFEAELIEHPVGSRAFGYAGRFDVIGSLERDRSERWLIDLKTSASVYGDTALQTAAYARADFHVVPGSDVELPMPRVDRIGVVHVQPELSELYDLGDIDIAFNEFLNARALYVSDKRRADLVRAPLQLDTALF